MSTTTDDWRRCSWGSSTPAMQAYHDTEWGVPLHDDRALFELLTLEGAQAGLSWRTVLDRRQAYRDAFHNFDIARVMRMRDTALEKVLTESGVIRNRLKVFSVRDNARAALAAIEELGSFDAFLWGLIDGAPIVNAWTRPDQVPAQTEASDRMSKTLRKRGFRFVGSTICYAFMQASGMVDDHLTTCWRHARRGR
ncbi:MAG TPA: DNA-3-methyladenine glycosylase I [Acetobacteraceae bacterium]|nr:DNA-3-methyladenine glycosylase I [Acetobacteraceae bacterium]